MSLRDKQAMARASKRKRTTRWVGREFGFFKIHFRNTMTLHVKSQNLLRYCFSLNCFPLNCFSLDRLDYAFQMMVVRPEGFIKGWIKL